MSEQTKGAASGAVQGAAAGAMVGGPWGALVGGIVGGVWGSIGGRHGDKAKKYAKRAKKIQKQREEEAYRQQLLSVLREGRIQRASSLAMAVAMGTEEGSGSYGALGSIGSQIANQVEYMSVDRGREVLVSQLLAKAQKKAKKSKDTMGALSTTATIVGAIGTAATLASSFAAGEAASQAGQTAGGISQAGGIGSGVATDTASSIAGTAGMSGSGVLTPIGTMSTGGAGFFNAEVWGQASKQLMSKALMQQSLFNATMQTSRAYYSGTTLVKI